ncbi:D12 class N6 adenine-specific DNA methyltransferase [Nitrosomonas sp. Is79A3]|uniref:DNA adenine methylase n=1 Tax=Nitrosomonas sp. (strain Is79A3) TaxID=261292 RepID=UPI000215C9D8
MKLNTPLRYPGGRDKLSEFIKLIFEQNNLLDGNYAEPYAGGAGIALNLLTHGYVSCVHLNDANPAIFAFWHSVINQPEALCRAIHDVEITMKEWQRQKAILDFPASHSPLEVGFSIFFLNRVNRLGILWGGSDDGVNQDCHWKLDARFDKVDLIRRIEWIALYRSRIHLYNQNAADFIKTVLPTLPEKTLIYIDLPSFVKGRRLYENHNLHNAHVSIAELVKEHITQHWIVSCDSNPEIIQMYRGYPTKFCDINHYSRHHGKDPKVMFFSKKLIIPNLKNSSNLKTA